MTSRLLLLYPFYRLITKRYESKTSLALCSGSFLPCNLNQLTH